MNKHWDITPPTFDDLWMLRTIASALTFYGDFWVPMTSAERDQIETLAEMYAHLIMHDNRAALITDLKKMFEEPEDASKETERP